MIVLFRYTQTCGILYFGGYRWHIDFILRYRRYADCVISKYENTQNLMESKLDKGPYSIFFMKFQLVVFAQSCLEEGFLIGPTWISLNFASDLDKNIMSHIFSH